MNAKQTNLILGTVAVAALALLLADPALAQATTGNIAGFGSTGGTNTIGGGFVSVVSGTIQGNLGLAAGVAFAAFGAYMWLVKQETWAGIGAILFGAILALVPGLMNGIYTNITKPIIGLIQTNTSSGTLSTTGQ